tara:strand:- start:73 stop:990 length:918 start_codon:yes stop_codon:yes gene_type:complete
MKIFRVILPLYNKIIENSSRGRGYGKKKSVRKMMNFFNYLFRSDEVNVRGHKMYLPKEGFGEYSTLGIYGKLDTFTVESLLQPGDYVIDIGAAIGYFTLIFAGIVGKDGLVIAFEPKEDRFEILSKNVKVNNFKNVKLEKKAILANGMKGTFFSRDDGQAGLRFRGNDENSIKSFGTHKHTTPNQVSTINLDDYLKNLGVLEKISFMKIDVDGPELLVLLSSQSLLKNNNLKILIEWDQKNSKISGCDPASIIDLFIDNNFKIFYPNHEKNKFFQVSKNELLKMEGDVNILCVKNSSILENKGLL